MIPISGFLWIHIVCAFPKFGVPVRFYSLGIVYPFLLEKFLSLNCVFFRVYFQPSLPQEKQQLSCARNVWFFPNKAEIS